eukprot:1812649-Amphidinium_carterae.1
MNLCVVRFRGPCAAWATGGSERSCRPSPGSRHASCERTQIQCAIQTKIVVSISSTVFSTYVDSSLCVLHIPRLGPMLLQPRVGFEDIVLVDILNGARIRNSSQLWIVQ